MSRLFIFTSIIISSTLIFGFLSLKDNPRTDANKSYTQLSDSTMNKSESDMKTKIVKSDEEWKKELTPEQYYVLRQKGTEPAFTGEYYHLNEDGIYTCAACGNELFSSDTKYESGSGWPSYWAPVDEGKVKLIEDHSLGMVRTEVVCGRCGGHLGHVFDDGPKPTGKRYCINSAALEFKKK